MLVSYNTTRRTEARGPTQKTVRHMIDDYLIPRWGKQAALDIRALDMETWLDSLQLARRRSNKENDTKAVQGLLRHANVSTKLGLYAQSVNSSMEEAQESMLKAILRNGSNAVN
jgi:hypothetical protein